MKLSKRIQKTNHTRKKQHRREQIARNIGQANREVQIDKNRAEENEDDSRNSNNSSFVEIEIEPSEYNVDQRLSDGILCDIGQLKNEDPRNLSSLNGSLNSPNCFIQQHNEIQEQPNHENGHQNEHEMQELFAVRKAIQDQTLISSQQQEILLNLLNCPLCLDVFKDPVYLKSCLHRICRDCIEKVIRVASIKRCPICRQEIGTRRLVREDDFLREIMKIVVGDVRKFNDDIDEIKAKQIGCMNQGKLNGNNKEKEEEEDKVKRQRTRRDDWKKNDGFMEQKKIEGMEGKQDGGIEREQICKQELNIDRSNDPKCSNRLMKLEVAQQKEADSITGRLLLRRRRQAKEDDQQDILRNQQNGIVCDDERRYSLDDRKKSKKESKERKKSENQEGEQEKEKQQSVDTSEDKGIETRRITRNNIRHKKQSRIIENISKDSISTNTQTIKAKHNDNTPKTESFNEQKIGQSLERVARSSNSKILIDKTTKISNESIEGIKINNQSNNYAKGIKKKGRIQKKTRESLRIQQIQFDLAGIGRTLNGKIQRRSIKIQQNPQQQQQQQQQLSLQQ